MRFPIMAPNSNLRNPVLYPAELRGHTDTAYPGSALSATTRHIQEADMMQAMIVPMFQAEEGKWEIPIIPIRADGENGQELSALQNRCDVKTV